MPHVRNSNSAWVVLQRNGPSAYQHIISALEGRRLQQEDEGLHPSARPLYRVPAIKILLGSVRNELRLAMSKIREKPSAMSWSQVSPASTCRACRIATVEHAAQLPNQFEFSGRQPAVYACTSSSEDSAVQQHRFVCNPAHSRLRAVDQVILAGMTNLNDTGC